MADDGLVFRVPAAQAGWRLDRVLRARFPAAGREAVRALLAEGAVRIEGNRGDKGRVLRAGEEVRLSRAPAEAAAAPDPAAAAALVLRYEDAHLVVVDKPAGMPCHPLRAGEGGTVADGLLSRYPEMRDVGHGPRDAGLLHRLDTHTSGLLLAARDARTFVALWDAMRRGAVHKVYVARCVGAPPPPGVLHAHLRARGPRVQVRDAPFEGSRPVSAEVLRAEACTQSGHARVWISVPFAARHQVRAQLAFVGLPLVGDVAYGGPAREPGGHLLHACGLTFVHPHDGQEMRLSSDPPAAFWG